MFQMFFLGYIDTLHNQSKLIVQRVSRFQCFLTFETLQMLSWKFSPKMLLKVQQFRKLWDRLNRHYFQTDVDWFGLNLQILLVLPLRCRHPAPTSPGSSTAAAGAPAPAARAGAARPA